MRSPRAFALLLLTTTLSFAQAPEIFEVTPIFGRPGDILTIEGQDFDRTLTNISVHIGDVRARVIEASLSELKVEVPRGVQPGPITVAAGGFSAMSPLPFSPLFEPFGGTNQCYLPRQAIFHTNSLLNYSAADFDGDGTAELVAVTSTPDVRIYQFRRVTPFITTNSFRVAALFAVEQGSTTAIPMDYDSDGRIDLMLAGTSGLRFFRNIHSPDSRTRTGTNELSWRSFAAPRFEPRPLSLNGYQTVDLDRDGRIDLVTRVPAAIFLHKNVYDPRSNNVPRLFAPQVRLNATSPISSFHAADLNRDGHMEIAVNALRLSIFSHHDRAGVLNANSFAEVATFTNTAPNLLGVADIEGDGFLDLIGRQINLPELSVFWNRTEGDHITTNLFPRVRLQSRQILPSVGFTANILSDMNGDGRPDLLGTGPNFYPNLTAYTPGVITSDAFAASVSRLGGTVQLASPFGIADLNGDGAPEFLALPRGNTLTILENTCASAPVILGTLDHELLQLRAYGTPMEMLVIESSRNLRDWRTAFTIRPDSTGEIRRSIPPSQTEFFRVRRDTSHRAQAQDETMEAESD